MSKVLYIKASPRNGRSHSMAVADAFLTAYRKTHPDDQVQTIDLFARKMPAFDGLTVQAKYTILHGQQHSPEELSVWRDVEQLITEFKAADKYVLAVPMWNFGIPYRLKQYFDNLVQPGYTFSYTPETGYTGLVTKKPVFVAMASGGDYRKGTGAEALDFTTPYLKTVLGFIGFTDIHMATASPMLAAGPEGAAHAQEKAIGEAVRIAQTF